MKFQILKKETLIALFKNSVGSGTFRSLIARDVDSNVVSDILHEGEYSCAYFVSCLLVITDYLDKPRATVESTKKYLKEHYEEIAITDAIEGDVVVWEKMKYPSGNEHAHIGFLLNSTEAISTDYETRKIEKHDVHDKNRVVSAVYRLP